MNSNAGKIIGAVFGVLLLLVLLLVLIFFVANPGNGGSEDGVSSPDSSQAVENNPSPEKGDEQQQAIPKDQSQTPEDKASDAATSSDVPAVTEGRESPASRELEDAALTGDKAAQAKINELSEGKLTEGVTAGLAMTLVFDVSSSMDDPSAYGDKSKLETAKEQGAAFVRSIESQANQSGLQPTLGLVAFSNSSDVFQSLTDDYDAVDASVDSLSTIGGTNIYAGLSESIAQLEDATDTKMLVLLSDGVDTLGNSDESILELAEDAADKDIKIYTIGFGSSDDLNEDLLQEIADITGGEYSHEDPSSVTGAAVGIFATMLKAQLSATSQVLLDATGTVAQGKTSDVGSFSIDQQGDIHTVLYWPGSRLDLKLVDPDGVEVGEGYPGYSIQDDTIPTQIYVTGAKRGQWGMSVYGAEVSMAEEPYYAITVFNENDAAAPIAAGGGAIQDSGSKLIFLLIAVVSLGIIGLVAYIIRTKRGEKK
jgi:hypothetical protein